MAEGKMGTVVYPLPNAATGRVRVGDREKGVKATKTPLEVQRAEKVLQKCRGRRATPACKGICRVPKDRKDGEENATEVQSRREKKVSVLGKFDASRVSRVMKLCQCG